MNCSDFELQIASESDDPAVSEHLQGCRNCREFARDLVENAAALRAIDLEPAAYTALRARVMEAVRPRPRSTWSWAAAGVLAAACLALFWFTAPLRVPPLEPPRAVTFRIAPPKIQAPLAAAKPVHRRVRRRPEPRPQLAAIKLLTDDPNVVIIWLVDNKGDSL